MKNPAWPPFSFTEALAPPPGWRTDCALLSTYSADFVVVVTVLLALTGCDLDDRVGSRVELVKAIEALRGKVCVLAQAGRIIMPSVSRPVFKLLDRFVQTVDADEQIGSWHPKAALVRYRNIEEPGNTQWLLWLGSRNLTRSLNWETGLVLVSRADGKGKGVAGLAAMAERLAARAKLKDVSAKDIAAELAELTWECPHGCDVQSVRLFGPQGPQGFPTPPADTERVLVISPFLDSAAVRAAAGWGGKKTRRTLVSTDWELQRLMHEDGTVFEGYEALLTQPLPDLPAEYADVHAAEGAAAAEVAESEELPLTGLHAKMLYAAKGVRRQLWVGSANATGRGWEGRNFEIVAESEVTREVADAIEEFVASCRSFVPAAAAPPIDADEKVLEEARKALSARWPLRQRLGADELEVIARAPPPLLDPTIELEIAALGSPWTLWPHTAVRLRLPGHDPRQRSDFLQIRVTRAQRVCAWVQIAPCDPPLDERRDHALIAQYLDARTFLIWLRNLLADQPPEAAGGDWDAAEHASHRVGPGGDYSLDMGVIPTVEEVLRAWARDSAAFAAADEKVTTYLGELERRAGERGVIVEVELLRAFRDSWSVLASELR